MRITLGLFLLMVVVGVSAAQPFPRRDLSLSGDRNYLLEESGMLDIIDASDPTALVLLGQIDPNPAEYITGTKVVCYGTTAYVLEQRQTGPMPSILTVIDASSPAVPVAGVHFNYGEYTFITGLAVDAERGLLFVGFDQLCCYDLSDPLHPALVDQIDLDFYRPVADIQVQDTIAYCAQGYLGFTEDMLYGIALVDAGDPSAMQELTYVANYPTRLGDSFRVDGDLLFSISYEEFSDPNHYFRIHDLSDPYAPQLLAEIVTPLYGPCMRRWGNVVYYTGGAAGVGRIDVSDLEAPVLLDPLPGTEGAVDLEIREDGWLFAVLPSELRAISLEPTMAPDAPVPAGLRVAAWPNPFNPKVTLAFSLDAARVVKVSIHAADGRLVADFGERSYAAGGHTLNWNGEDEDGRPQASGVYLLRVEAGGASATQRLVLLR